MCGKSIKKMAALLLAAFCLLALAGCGGARTAGSPPEKERMERKVSAAPKPEGGEEENQCPPELPTALASASDLDGGGGYLLLGETADIALYCDNLEERSQAYIRYGDAFQAFRQEAWTDPSVLPELSWSEATGELTVKYLRHEGVYFDGETRSLGLVYEMVLYQWDGTRWTDVHFTSGGLMERA